jgi:hypothetical protein
LPAYLPVLYGCARKRPAMHHCMADLHTALKSVRQQASHFASISHASWNPLSGCAAFRRSAFSHNAPAAESARTPLHPDRVAACHFGITRKWLAALGSSLNHARPSAADPVNAIALMAGCFVIEIPCPTNTLVSRCAGCAFSIRRFPGARAEAASRPAKGRFSARTQQLDPADVTSNEHLDARGEPTISLIDASIYPRALFQCLGKRLSSPVLRPFQPATVAAVSPFSKLARPVMRQLPW